MPDFPLVEYPTIWENILPYGYLLVSFPSLSVTVSAMHLSIIRQDLPAHDLLCKCLLSGIIRIIDKFLALKKLEVRKISHQTDKQCQK